MLFSSAALKDHAITLGFNLVGVTRAEPSPYLSAYEHWLEAGMHGTMGYMARPDRLARRRDLNQILPGVQTLIVVGLDYTAAVDTDFLQDPSRGRIAAYAWGLDYHDILTPRLEALAAWLQTASGHSLHHRVYVDTGAILERSHAHQAGLGFTGKNTMLIHPLRGSSFFLGEILTDIELDTYDTPGRATLCGTCTRCLNACPTAAFPRPHVLDARRCISYLTIEHKGSIALDLRPRMGNWVYGCDICQDMCPFQRFARPTHEASFKPVSLDHMTPKLVDLLALDESGFHQRYYGTPIYRIKRDRLVRNACVAAGNWGSPQAIKPLHRLLADSSPLVRSHAAWALHRIMADDARGLLQAQAGREQDTEVREAIQSLLDSG